MQDQRQNVPFAPTLVPDPQPQEDLHILEALGDHLLFRVCGTVGVVVYALGNASRTIPAYSKGEKSISHFGIDMCKSLERSEEQGLHIEEIKTIIPCQKLGLVAQHWGTCIVVAAYPLGDKCVKSFARSLKSARARYEARKL